MEDQMATSARQEAQDYLDSDTAWEDDPSLAAVRCRRLLKQLLADNAPAKFDQSDITTWDDERLLDEIQPVIFTHPADRTRITERNQRFETELERRGYVRNK